VFGLNDYLNSPTKKLHARAIGPYQIIRKLGSNAYVLDLPDNLGISSILNVEDLTFHRGTFKRPSLPFGASPSIQVPKPSTFPQSHIDIEAVLDDEFVSSSRGGSIASWYNGLATHNQMPLGLQKMSSVNSTLHY